MEAGNPLYKAADTKDVWFEITKQAYTINGSIKPLYALPQTTKFNTEGEWITLIDSHNRYPHITDTRDADTLRLTDVSDEGRVEIEKHRLSHLTTRYDQLGKFQNIPDAFIRLAVPS